MSRQPIVLLRWPCAKCLPLLGGALLLAAGLTVGAMERQPVAWGTAVDGVRFGLAPETIILGARLETAPVQVWYENVGKESCEVPSFAASNTSRIMFRGQRAGREFFVTYRMDRLALTRTEMKRLKPGEIFHETLTLHFGGDQLGYVGLPELKPGESLVLQAALVEHGDPHKAEDWQAAKSLMSGTIKLERAANASK